MADRFCGNCGQELRPDDRFCPNCGRAIHETAVVLTPDADVAVPPLPDQQEPSSEVGSGGQSSRVSSADSTRNSLIALGVVVAVIFLIAIVTAGGRGIGVVLMLLILPALALFFRTGDRGAASREGDGRMVLRPGFEQPLSQSERSRLLEEEVGQYMRDGFFVRQLVKQF